MIASIALASALLRPPDGTYSYRLIQSAAVVGTSTVVVTTNGNRITAVEDASIPLQGVTAHTVTVFDASTLDEESYTADFHLPSGVQHTSVTLAGGKAMVDAGPQHVVIAADASAPLMITTANMPGEVLWIPAVLQAHHASAFTLAVLTGGRAVLAGVQSGTPPPRPSGVPKTDVPLSISAGGLGLTYWYNPANGVVDVMAVPAQQVRAELVSHTASTAKAATPKPLATALPLPPAHYTSRNVTFTSQDGTRLAGTLTIPEGTRARYPIVVLVHGSGPENRNEQIGPNAVFLQLANALSNGGFAVLRYDKRGIGKSGGNAATTTRNQLLQDVEAALRFARAQPHVDGRRIYLLGHSEGGELVPTVAAHTNGIAGIVLMAPPALPLGQVVMEQVLESVPPAKRALIRQKEAAALAGVRSGKNRGAGMPWLQTSMDVDPVNDIAHVRVPTLILQGGSDAQVLPKDLPRLVTAAKKNNERVTVRVFPGDNHLFMHAQAGTANDPQAALHQYLTVPARIDPAVLQTLLAWLNGAPAQVGLHAHICMEGRAKLPAECGTFGVYENRRTRSGRVIALNFVVVKAKHASRGVIAEIAGGPGEAATDFAAFLADGRLG